MLQPLLNEDDLQKFFEVYDIRHDDLQETSLGYGRVDADDNETIKQLRVHQYHFSTLRRMVLCSLLSLPATGRNADAVRWKTAVKEMERLSILMDQSAQDLNKLLDEEERTYLSDPTTFSTCTLAHLTLHQKFLNQQQFVLPLPIPRTVLRLTPAFNPKSAASPHFLQAFALSKPNCTSSETTRHGLSPPPLPNQTSSPSPPPSAISTTPLEQT